MYPVIHPDDQIVGTKGVSQKYPFDQMKVGSMFFVPKEDLPKSGLNTITTSALMAGVEVNCKTMKDGSVRVVMIGPRPLHAKAEETQAA